MTQESMTLAQQLAISTSPLRAPQHWHVGIMWYTTVDENGNLLWSTHFDIVTNDITLAITWTRKRSDEVGGPNTPRRARFHIREMHMCADVDHLENLDEELWVGLGGRENVESN